MNILSYVVENGRIKLTTDSLVMPIANYDAYKFRTLAALKAEIEAKITEINARNASRDITDLTDELDVEVTIQ